MEHQQERRRSRRFDLRQTAVVRPSDGISLELTALTENASLYGVLLRAPAAIAEASPVEVELCLCRDGMQGVQLRGTGRVVRSDAKLTGGFAIAVAFDQPLTEDSHAHAVTA